MTRKHRGGTGSRRKRGESGRAAGERLDDAAVGTDAREAATGAEAGEARAGAEVEREIGALREELEALNGKWLRALADLDNYKKRVERDRARWADTAREEVLLDVLDVVDSFERALASSGGRADRDSFRSGVELILKQLTDVLRKHGVVPIETRGREFDPNVHEAVAHVESDEHDANQIVEETQRGYMHGDRLLRCSKVVVSK